MEIHELNTKALTSPAYMAADDGDDTYKFDFNAMKAVTDGQISALSARADDIEGDISTIESDIDTLEDRPKIWYGTTSTGSAVETKDVTCANFALKHNDYIVVQFSQPNSVDIPKLNINNVGAYYISNGAYARPFLIENATYVMFRIRYQSNANTWYFDVVGQVYGAATTSKQGYMSAADKTALDQAVSDIAEIETEIAVLDNPEGMTVGNAEQLLSDVYTEDSEPYKYRPSFSGDREFDEIVGGTVAWNQIVVNGNFASASGWGGNNASISVASNKCTLTPNSANAATALRNAGLNGTAQHVLFCGMTVTTSKATACAFYIGGGATTSQPFSVPANTRTFVTGILKVNTATGGSYFYCDRNAVLGSSDSCVFENVFCVDITRLLGSTIADYILAQEQATAGAGVAIFRKLFPESYYAYNAGELISVSGLSAHEMVGKNLLKPYTAGTTVTSAGITGTANSDGSITFTGTASGTFWGLGDSPDFELPAGTYRLSQSGAKSGMRLNLVKREGSSTTVVSVVNGDTDTSFTLTELSTLYFYNKIDSGIATNVTIYPQVEFGTQKTAYEPYKKHSYPLDSSLTLRGIPKLANGKMYFDGDTYQSDGTVTRRYGVVDLGTLTWTYLNDGIFRASKMADAKVYYLPNWICGKYDIGVATNYAGWKTRNKQIGYLEGYQYVICMDTSYTDAASFTSAVSGTYLVYELATATTETAEPFTNPQIVSEYGTEEYVSATICPVGHNTKYPENLRKKIEGLPWDLSMIAPIENGTTASKAYSVGQYFLHNNVFCKAKTAIASGATFTLNTNYEETTVAAELYSALH